MESNQFLKDENDSLEKELASKCEMVEDFKTEVLELQKLIAQKTEAEDDLENRECVALEELRKLQEKLEEVNKLREDELNEKHLEIDSLQKGKFDFLVQLS